MRGVAFLPGEVQQQQLVPLAVGMSALAAGLVCIVLARVRCRQAARPAEAKPRRSAIAAIRRSARAMPQRVARAAKALPRRVSLDGRRRAQHQLLPLQGRDSDTLSSSSEVEPDPAAPPAPQPVAASFVVPAVYKSSGSPVNLDIPMADIHSMGALVKRIVVVGSELMDPNISDENIKLHYLPRGGGKPKKVTHSTRWEDASTATAFVITPA